MKIGYLFMFLILLVVTVPVIAQEICDNAIDDDGDGLIDYQDPDCHCDGISTFYVNSIIPNPSFERKDSCPKKVSQLEFAESWVQATWGTTDYFSLCGYMGRGYVFPPLPLPDGESCVGIITAGIFKSGNKYITYQEYLGTQLLKDLQRDTAYTLHLSVGFGTPDTTVDASGEISTVDVPSSVTLVVYGHKNKVNFPLKTRECITKNLNYQDWDIITTYTINNATYGWKDIALKFTPSSNYKSIIIGGECSTIKDTNDIYDYILLDNLILSKSSSFNFGTPSKIGSTCNKDLRLKAPPVSTIVAYQWYKNGVAIPGEFSPILNLGDAVGKNGYYSVVISSTTGDCAQSDSIYISGNNEYNLPQPGPWCAGDSITLDAGAGFSTYKWSTSEITQTITVSQPGNYSVTVMKSNGCMGMDTVTVDNPIDIQIAANLNNSIFGESSGSINVTITGGIQPYSFQWSTAETTEDIDSLPGGQYILQVWGSNGCYATNTFTIKAIPRDLTVQITVGAVLCAEENTGSIKVNINGGIPPYEIKWPELGLNTNIVSNLSAGEYNFIVSDSQGTQLKSSAIIPEPDKLIVKVLTVTEPSCYASANGAIEIDVTGGVLPYNIDWSNSSSTSTQLQDLKAGVYEVTVIDKNNCITSQEISLEQPEKLSAEIISGNPLCYGQENGYIRIIGPSGGTQPYSYFLNGERVALQAFQNLSSGNYQVEIIDKQGCSIDSLFTLEQPNIIKVNVSADDPIILEGDSSRLFLEVLPELPLNLNSFWKINTHRNKGILCDTCTQQVVYPLRTTTYTFVVTNGSCTYSDKVTIKVEPIRVYTPNAFSPNDDGINDVLIIGTNQDELIVHLFEVYNRWGQRVYSIKDIPLKDFKGWDGTSQGHILRSGVYVYKIDLMDHRGKHIQRRSTITILK